MSGFLNNMGPGSFLDALTSQGANLGSNPMLTKKKSGFKLDKKGRVKEDPLTGEKIKPKDRRKFKRIKRNPFGLSPGMSLNMALPNILTGENIPGGSLASILASVNRVGGQ